MRGGAGGAVEALLGLLATGGRTLVELADALGVPAGDVVAAIGLFDEYGLVEDGDPRRMLPAEVQERHFSNLAFFESFASLSGPSCPGRCGTLMCSSSVPAA